MLKYLIVDDEEIDRMAIETQAAKFPMLHKIASCSHPLEALELITRFKPDIIFADIEMPDMTGLELVKSLAGQVATPVFITSHPEFAIEGYEIEAFDFLTKPINPERFAKCISRLLDFYELRNKSYAFDKEHSLNSITIKQGYDQYKISINDILYLEAMKDYTKIVTQSAQFLVLATFTNMHDQLPSEKFIRIHRSYIVNRDKITASKGNKLYISAHELPVGKLYKPVLNGLF